MKRNGWQLCMMAAMVSGAGALADSPDWTYVEASYLSSDIDDDVEPEGGEVRASWLFNDWAYVEGSYSQQDDDIGTPFGDLDLELDVWNIGLGSRFALSSNTDIYGRISYENWKLELESLNEDENGYGIAAGIRSIVWQRLELNAEVGYLDVGDAADGEARFKVGSMYHFKNGIGVGLSYGEIDDLDTVSATLRYSFR